MPRPRRNPLSDDERREIEAWIERHRPELEAQIDRESRYWGRKLPRWSHLSREDLIQEAWEVALRVGRVYNAGHLSKARPGTLLTTSVRNRFKDILDKEMRSLPPLTASMYRDDDLEPIAPSVPSVADILARFRSLTPKEAEWAEAFASENGSPKRAAKRQGTTVTIANRLLARLGEKL